jgi:hypothetical protein
MMNSFFFHGFRLFEAAPPDAGIQKMRTLHGLNANTPRTDGLKEKITIKVLTAAHAR